MIRSLNRLLFVLLCLSINLAGYTQSVGGTTSGQASYCSGNNSGFVSLTGYVGLIVQWESSTDLLNWNNLGNPTPTQSYSNLTQTTHYRAIVQDNGFPPDTSTISTITVFVPADGGIISGGGTFCEQSGTGTLTLSGETGNVLYWQFSTDGGTNWTQVANTTNTLNHPNITQATLYEAVVENVVGCPIDTSSQASFSLDVSSVAGILSSDATVCSGVNQDSVTLTGTVGNITDWITSVDNGTTWTSLGFSGTGIAYSNLTQSTSYQVIAQSGVCPPDSSNIVSITVVLPNPVTAGPDVEIILHESTALTANGDGNPTWSPPTGLDDPLSFNPLATPSTTTTYVVTLVDSNQCVSKDTVVVTVDVPIPSAITPNGDGVNDFFHIDNIENLPDNHLSIYGRQGTLVFEAAPYDNRWNGVGQNGADLPDGIYYYVLELGAGSPPLNGFILVKR